MSKRITALACMGLSLAAAAHVGAKTLTVAKSGGQYATLQAGVNAAAAGDTVLAKAGVYNEHVSFGKSGSASAGFITLLAEKGAILDGTGDGGDYLVEIDSKSFIRLEGFEIRNLKGNGTPKGISISGSGSNIQILRNHVHNIENPNGNAHGIAVYGTSATPISKLLVDGNEINACKLGESESMVLNGNVSDFVVSNNTVHDNDNIGIDFIGFEGVGPSGKDQANNGRCFGNKVYNISSADNPAYGGERSADGIYVDGGRDIVIERNIVDNCDIAFEIASEHGGKSTSNITIRNNFASRSYQGNIMAGGYDSDRGNADNVIIVNNTTYSGRGGEIVLQHNCKGVALKNNILWAAAGGGYLVQVGSNNTAVVADNNLYFGGSTTSSGAWRDVNALFANPKLKSAPANLHLAEGSPALNAGSALDTALAGRFDIDQDPRVSGAKMDIGADEVGAATTFISTRAAPLSPQSTQPRRNALGRRVPASDGLGFSVGTKVILPTLGISRE